jgi:hypothetical protein
VIAGRGEEQLAITSVLDAARNGRGAALCLVGEPGIGKSTLLDWACEEAAEGFTVLRTSGVESDFAVPYAGLLDLAGPLRPALRDVPDGQRVALEGVLGWTQASAGTPLLVAAAGMTLLSAAASARPVLVVVDDLQWLDQESARVLDFAVPRLHLDPVAFLLARREGWRAPAGGNVRELGLRGLDAASAGRLLTGLAPVVSDHLMQQTAGNPLALLEAAGALTPAQRRGSAALPDIATIGERLVQGFRAAVATLSEPARRLVHVAAAAHQVDAGALLEILRTEGVHAEVALDEARAAGLLALGSAVSFTHPLHRAAAWSTATPAERRSAHHALAASAFLDPQVRLRHRIEATSGYDDELSEQVEQWCEADRSRLGYAGGADLLARAADLSRSPERAALLRARAAEDALAAGDLDRVRELARAVLDGASPWRRGPGRCSLWAWSRSTPVRCPDPDRCSTRPSPPEAAWCGSAPWPSSARSPTVSAIRRPWRPLPNGWRRSPTAPMSSSRC